MVAGALAKGRSVQLLLAAGADSFAVNDAGKTVLDLFNAYILNMEDFNKAMGMSALLTNKVWPKDSPRGLEEANKALCKLLLNQPRRRYVAGQ
jgi:hypothetical protein